MEHFMPENILVTGGAGYIGSHVCKQLKNNGYTPVAYDNLSNGHERLVKWGPFEKGDICDKARLSEVFEKYNPIAVIHFAAFIEVGESVKYPEKFYKNNIGGTETLLKVMTDFGVDKIVFSSSCAVHGEPEKMPIAEDDPIAPINPYGETKAKSEQLLDEFGVSHGLKSVALRYFNVCGSDIEGETGEMHSPESHIIPLAIFTALGIRDSFSVFGMDYDTKDGSCIRDYINVNDLANAHIVALKHLSDGGNSDKINVGTGKGVSVLEIIKAVETVSGKKIPVKYAERRAGDSPMLYSDTSKCQKVLGFSPRFDDVNESIKQAWQWHKKLYDEGYYTL
jgi:UDP-glucose-4-epimerase GalE